MSKRLNILESFRPVFITFTLESVRPQGRRLRLIWAFSRIAYAYALMRYLFCRQLKWKSSFW